MMQHNLMCGLRQCIVSMETVSTLQSHETTACKKKTNKKTPLDVWGDFPGPQNCTITAVVIFK